MIAVDWGTSSLRLYRMADDGQVRERRRSDQGVLACAGRFGDVLAQEIAGWDDTGRYGARSSICAAMRGSVERSTRMSSMRLRSISIRSSPTPIARPE